MASIGSQIIANMVAGEDLSTRQFWAVTLSGSDNTAASPTAVEQPLPIGVLLNDPSSGEAAEVCVFGLTKLKCNTATDIGCGDLLTLDASYLGAVQASASGQYFGRAMEAATSGCPIIRILWTGNHGFVGDTVA